MSPQPLAPQPLATTILLPVSLNLTTLSPSWVESYGICFCVMSSRFIHVVAHVTTAFLFSPRPLQDWIMSYCMSILHFADLFTHWCFLLLCFGYCESCCSSGNTARWSGDLSGHTSPEVQVDLMLNWVWQLFMGTLLQVEGIRGMISLPNFLASQREALKSHFVFFFFFGITPLQVYSYRTVNRVANIWNLTPWYSATQELQI